jgi:hypothetical protein
MGGFGQGEGDQRDLGVEQVGSEVDLRFETEQKNVAR